MPAKVLITGLSNSGKTSLTKTLRNALIISRDGKKCAIPIPHKNMSDFESIKEFRDEMFDTIEKYKEKNGTYPETVVIDSVSQIFTEIENYCNTKYNGFEVWKNVSMQVEILRLALEEIADAMNLVIIAHCILDVDTGKYTEVCKGSFAKKGGFLSTVDYAINIVVKGKKRTVHHKANELSRSLLETVPDSQDVAEFDLQHYIEEINKVSVDVAEWELL